MEMYLPQSTIRSLVAYLAKIRIKTWSLVILATLASTLSLTAEDSKTGWLQFKNGERIIGELIEVTNKSGTFQSKRFGVVSFTTEEASFVEQKAPAQIAEAPKQRNDTIPASNSKPWWQPDHWHVNGSVTYKNDAAPNKAANREIDYEVELSFHWTRGYNNHEISLRGKDKRREGADDDGEENAHIRLQRDTDTPWFIMGELYAERDDVARFGNKYDYLLTKTSAGGGLKKTWDKGHVSRVALLYNFAYAQILDIDPRLDSDTEGVSIFISNEVALTKHLALSQWGEFYFWQSSEQGLAHEIELTQKLNEKVSLGLRHTYTDRDANLKGSSEDELKLFTRITF